MQAVMGHLILLFWHVVLKHLSLASHHSHARCTLPLMEESVDGAIHHRIHEMKNLSIISMEGM